MKFKIKAASSDNKIRIYLTNLGKYNEGKLVGDWVDLPVNDNFKSVLNKIGISNKPDAEGNIYEEWFITDYEAPFKIGEYDNINELNEIAKKCQNFSDIDWLAFSEFIDNGYSKEESFEKVENQEYTFIEGITEREVGENYLDIIGGIESLSREELERNFDYEHFGRDVIINGSYSRVKKDDIFGYISIN